MAGNDYINFTSPCGIYCTACPEHENSNSCHLCRLDARHNKCDIFDCCVTLGGMDFCFECDYFPCERLEKFVDFNPGKRFAHFRHIAIDMLKRIKDIGPEMWVKEMNKKTLSGEYSIMTKDENGKLDTSPCFHKKNKV